MEWIDDPIEILRGLRQMERFEMQLMPVLAKLANRQVHFTLFAKKYFVMILLFGDGVTH